MGASGHILIVEDDREIREALRDLLVDEGYVVGEAEHGQAALKLLGDAALPCLILLDLMMPVMNGWQFRQAQLKDARLAGLPVVVVSADGNLADKAAQVGAAGFLKKPIPLPALLETIDRFCPHRA